MDAPTVKRYLSGTHRVVSPCETLARVQPFLPKVGITRIANVTGLDTIGIPVVMACRPNSRSLSVSQGKGLDLDAAKVSAVMESVEAYHAESILLPLKLSSYQDLRAGHRVVDVEQLQPAADSYFHPHLPLLWIEGDDWMRDEKVWVPFQMVQLAYTVAMCREPVSFAQSSNGLASGNHLLEAASHAICEVVERDASHLFSLLSEAEQESCRIDLASIDDLDCRQVLEQYDRAGVAVAVWDITGTVGIAAFHCSIVERDEDPFRRLMAAEGAGCHPVRHIALLRALTEAAQSRLTAISGARDDMPLEEYLEWREPANLARQRERANRPGARSYAAVPSFESNSFEEDIAWEMARVRESGRERIILIDLTRPEFGLPVVRVLIPGMQLQRPGAPTIRDSA
jgi:YcaO-like protein with predicted kinase domain